MKLNELAVVKNGEHTLDLRDDIDPRKWASWIQLTCHREAHRLERLERTAIAIGSSRPHTAIKIARLHDRKGLLAVTWAERPTDEEIEVVDLIWCFTAREGGPVIHHSPDYLAGDYDCECHLDIDPVSEDPEERQHAAHSAFLQGPRPAE